MALQTEQPARVDNILNGAYEKFPGGPECYRAATLDATLRALFQSAVEHANSRIEWYGKNAQTKSATAKLLRKWSLILFAVGTIAPISVAFLLQITEKFGSGSAARDKWNTFDYFAILPMAEVGYLLLAFAGALIIFDQFFDSSGSWIRFRQSEARLQVLLAEFRFAWAALMARAGGAVTQPSQLAEFTTLLRDFVTKVEMLAEEETAAWAQRFSERLSSFDRNPNLKVTLSGDQAANGATTAAANGGSVPNGSSSAAGAVNGAAAAPAGESAGTPASAAAVSVRLAINGADTVEPGSLTLSVNDMAVDVPTDGMIELPLDLNVRHHLVATGIRRGQAVRAELTFTPTADDEDKALALELN